MRGLGGVGEVDEMREGGGGWIGGGGLWFGSGG